jgi:predicted AAA+ superfamily ATPase
MVRREITDLLRVNASEFRAILLVGPRQSGKTTLVKQVFNEKRYISLFGVVEFVSSDNI